MTLPLLCFYLLLSTAVRPNSCLVYPFRSSDHLPEVGLGIHIDVTLHLLRIWTVLSLKVPALTPIPLLRGFELLISMINGWSRQCLLVVTDLFLLDVIREVGFITIILNSLERLLWIGDQVLVLSVFASSKLEDLKALIIV